MSSNTSVGEQLPEYHTTSGKPWAIGYQGICGPRATGCTCPSTSDVANSLMASLHSYTRQHEASSTHSPRTSCVDFKYLKNTNTCLTLNDSAIRLIPAQTNVKPTVRLNTALVYATPPSSVVALDRTLPPPPPSPQNPGKIYSLDHNPDLL